MMEKQDKPATDQDKEKDHETAGKGADSTPSLNKKEEDMKTTTPPQEKGTEETIGVP